MSNLEKTVFKMCEKGLGKKLKLRNSIFLICNNVGISNIKCFSSKGKIYFKDLCFMVKTTSLF